MTDTVMLTWECTRGRYYARRQALSFPECRFPIIAGGVYVDSGSLIVCSVCFVARLDLVPWHQTDISENSVLLPSAFQGYGDGIQRSPAPPEHLRSQWYVLFFREPNARRSAAR